MAGIGESKLEKVQRLAREGEARDRTRRGANPYDPTDLVPDGKDPNVIISDAGLDRGTVELLRHLDLELEGTRNTRFDPARAKPHLRNRAETPLDEYRNRHLLAPEDEQLNRAYWRAGRRLRSDWTTARLSPRLTQVLSQTVGNGSRRHAETDTALDAVDRLAQALRPLPVMPRACVVAVACCDQSATAWATIRRSPPVDSAMVVLRIGLEWLWSWYRQVDRNREAAA